MNNANTLEAIGIFSNERTKASWDRKTIIIFCDICIKEINNGNRPGTHFNKEGWAKIFKNFEIAAGKGYVKGQLKNKWDFMKKEWKVWKKLVGKDTGLGWNATKHTVDASDEWWESRLKVAPEAAKLKNQGIDPELEGKYDQMFMGIVATGESVWAPSSSILPPELEVQDNEILEENEENELHELQERGQHVHQKRKSVEVGYSNLKSRPKKSSKAFGGAAKLSSQIDKLCSVANNMTQATSNLTPFGDPYGIPAAMKVLKSYSNEFPKSSPLYFFALKLIVNNEKHTVFMELDEGERVWWLKMEMEDNSTFSSLLRP